MNIGSLQMNSDPMLMMQTQEPNENVTSNNFLSLWQGMNGDQQGDESQKAVPTSMTDQLQSILDCLTGNETNAVNNGDGSITLSNADKQMLSKLLKEIGSLTNKTNVSTQKKMLETKNALENGDDITALVNLVQLIGQMPVEDLQKLDKSSLQKLFQQANAVQNQETSSVQAGIQVLKMSETKDALVTKIKRALRRLNTVDSEVGKTSKQKQTKGSYTNGTIAHLTSNYEQKSTQVNIASHVSNLKQALTSVINQLSSIISNTDTSSKQQLVESKTALKNGDIQTAISNVLASMTNMPITKLQSMNKADLARFVRQVKQFVVDQDGMQHQSTSEQKLKDDFLSKYILSAKSQSDLLNSAGPSVLQTEGISQPVQGNHEDKQAIVAKEEGDRQTLMSLLQQLSHTMTQIDTDNHKQIAETYSSVKKDARSINVLNAITNILSESLGQTEHRQFPMNAINQFGSRKEVVTDHHLATETNGVLNDTEIQHLSMLLEGFSLAESTTSTGKEMAQSTDAKEQSDFVNNSLSSLLPANMMIQTVGITDGTLSTELKTNINNTMTILLKQLGQLISQKQTNNSSSHQLLIESKLALKNGDIQTAVTKMLDLVKDLSPNLLQSISTSKDFYDLKNQQNQLALNLLKIDGILKNTYSRAVENINKTSQMSADDHQEEVSNSTVSSMGALMTKTEQYVLHVGGEGKSASYQQFVADFSNILQRANLTKDTGTNKLFIKLNPENLGSLKIELIDQDGVLTAKILTSTSGAKDLLDSQLQQLKQAFAGQNIQLNQVHVIYQESSSQSPPFQQQSSSHEREQQQQQHKDHPEEEMEDDFFDFLLNNLIEMEA
ncbi:flagellar hook-length control protein FliK [Heyndrickxia ginsengihumi]|uniref:flagellar hook-length control protein FliK n=1 Tax=Heyndrickxia ginsengihumi TaxID=363870 RepID=UPI003D251E8A